MFKTLPRTNSMDSNCSSFSLGLSQKAESISDLSTTICKCDDCLLGITDALADLVLWNSSNSIQYASIDENTEVQHKNSASSSTNDSQGQFKPTEKLLKRKVSPVKSWIVNADNIYEFEMIHVQCEGFETCYIINTP